MHSMPLEAKAGGLGTMFPLVDFTHAGAAMSYTQRSQVFRRHGEWWDTAHSGDEVALRWMGTSAPENSSLGPLLSLRRRAQGEPTLGSALACVEAANAAALAVRRRLQACTPEGALRQRLLHAGVPEDAVTPARVATLLSALRRHVPRDMAVSCVKVIANGVATTRRMGEREAPCF